MSNQLPFDIERLSFDSFERNPARDVVCLAPIRTMVRREEEITLVRRVRKVEEIEAGVACPTNATTLSPENPIVSSPTIQELVVSATARVHDIQDYHINGRKDLPRQEFLGVLQSRNLLPYISNDQSQPMKVKITEIVGRWTYGPKESDENRFDLEVGADGNQQMIPKESGEGDLLFPNLPPASLVAFRMVDHGEYSYVAHGNSLTQTTFTLEPGEKLYFICNDEPGFYYDNKNHLTVKWGIA
jgi:hypothetical protein